MRKVLLIVMAVLLVGACTPKVVKVQSDDSRLAEEAFALAEEMRKAYVGKDFKTLEVEFNNGNHYGYKDVPESVFNDFIEADPPGRAFASEIKGQYQSTKL